jgi:hypothetical protein
VEGARYHTGTKWLCQSTPAHRLTRAQSLGWEHYEVHEPEPHILLFKYVFWQGHFWPVLTTTGDQSTTSLPCTKCDSYPPSRVRPRDPGEAIRDEHRARQPGYHTFLAAILSGFFVYFERDMLDITTIMIMVGTKHLPAPQPRRLSRDTIRRNLTGRP